MWVFTQYYHENSYPFGFFDIKIWFDFNSMKLYSAEQSAKYKELYPEYVSMYWKVI